MTIHRTLRYDIREFVPSVGSITGYLEIGEQVKPLIGLGVGDNVFPVTIEDSTLELDGDGIRDMFRIERTTKVLLFQQQYLYSQESDACLHLIQSLLEEKLVPEYQTLSKR